MNELQRNGATSGNKQARYAPIWVGSLRSGLVTNRSPLIGSTAPRMMEKFYGTSGDLFIAGSNVEISSRFSLIRRPGNSVYNGGSFSGVNAFYEFRLQNGTIKVIADTTATVKDITGTASTIFTKSANAGQTYFQSVLNTLFMGNGVDQKKYAYTTNRWAANTAFAPALTYSIGNIVQPGYTLIDPNSNLQVLINAGTSSATQPTWGTANGVLAVDSLPNLVPDSDGTVGLWVLTGTTFSTTGGAISGGSWNAAGTGSPSILGARSATFAVTPLATYTLSGYIDASHVSSGSPAFAITNPTVTTNYGNAAQTAGSNGRVTVTFTVPIGVTAVVVNFNSNGATIANATNLVFSNPQLELGSSATTYHPTSASPMWMCYGSPLQNWGIEAPVSAASPVNAALPNPPYPGWAANTFYAPSTVQLVDTNNNIQVLTTGGTTGATQPTWNASLNGTTTDGSAVWTNSGTANWQASNAYAVGAIIVVTYNVTIQVPDFNNDTDVLIGIGVGGPTPIPRIRTYVPFTITYSDAFQVTTAGTSAATQPRWQPGFGTLVNDGTAVWKNIGTTTTWANIGATVAVSTATKIQDTNGNIQIPTIPGLTGPNAPAWNTIQGSITNDNHQKWSNMGPLAAGATGSAATGTWTYGYAYKNSVANTVSSMSSQSTPILLSANSYVLVQGDGCPDSQCDTIIVFRTTQGGADLFWLADIPNPGAGQSWTFSDTFPDNSLNEFIAAPINGVNDPPPVGLAHLAYHLNRIWGSVGNVIYYSNPLTTTLGSGTEQFPSGSNYFVVPSVVTRLEPTSSGMMVFTTSNVFMVGGQGTPSSQLILYPLIEGIGLLSYNALAKTGSTYYLFTSSKKLIALDPSSGFTEPGYPIGDQLLNFNPSNAYLTFHDGGSTDTALYLADGSTGWYRLVMNSNSSVESPVIWSPFATIQGGVKAVQSVETSPGTHQLLLGPNSTGPVLKRDLTVWQDNGTPYTTSATIGSIVLAEPGQLAQVAFVSTDSVNVAGATRPTVGVIFDEVLPYYTGAFTTLTAIVNEPPRLAASQSLLSNRYYTVSPTTPAWCRHMQVQLSWPAENFQNELLTITLFGAVWVEK